MIDELDAIREVFSPAYEPDQERRLASRLELLSQIELEAGGQQTIGRRARPRRRFPRRLSLLGAGALSTVAAAVVAAVVLAGHNGAIQPPTAAAAVLERAAKAVATVSPLRLGPNQFWYVEDESAASRVGDLSTCRAQCYQISVMRWWVGANRFTSHVYVLGRPAKPTTITQAPPDVPMAAAKYSPRFSGVGGGYDRILGYQRMLTVPTNVQSLRRLLSRLGLPPNSRSLPPVERQQVSFANVYGILTQPRVPARMLSGLYRLLATLPGARLVGHTTDSLGRSAVEVRYEYPDAANTRATLELRLLFDPKTYVLIDLLSVASGKYASYQDLAFVGSGLVTKVGALPKN